MENSDWAASRAPAQNGRIALVTGATSGIGRIVAEQLAEAGAHVILAARDVPKAKNVAAEICKGLPHATISVEALDLASLASIAALAERMQADHPRLDLLINNAGVMFCPYGKTEDGFERQIGVNHLGHFALTLRLLPLLGEAKGSRVVCVASLAHRGGKIDLDDLMWENRPYRTTQAYCDSKLANLLFMRELNRRLRGRSADPIALAAHPGWTSTDLHRHSIPMRIGNLFLGQKSAFGSLPVLRAATDPCANADDYFGPRGFMEMRGLPVRVDMDDKAKDYAVAAALWERSEVLTRVRF